MKKRILYKDGILLEVQLKLNIQTRMQRMLQVV